MSTSITPVNSPQSTVTASATNMGLEGKFENQYYVVWKRFKKNKMAVLGLIVFSTFILMGIFAPWITPHDPIIGDLMVADQPPSTEYWFGTDSVGGDVFSRCVYAARVSLTIALVAMFISVSVGIIYGSISGYVGGWVDNVMMRIVDAISSFPTFFLLLGIAAVIPPSMWTTILVISLTGWVGISRFVRGEILSLKRRDYVEAAQASGETKGAVIFRHILPNAMGPIIVIATLDIAGIILAEAGLSFLGLGVQPPTPSWGNMLTQAQDLATLQIYPWNAIFPGMFIMLSVLAVNFIGDGLRDALDPRMKQ
jgi:peptide/nickel transport system permease protein